MLNYLFLRQKYDNKKKINKPFLLLPSIVCNTVIACINKTEENMEKNCLICLTLNFILII